MGETTWSRWDTRCPRQRRRSRRRPRWGVPGIDAPPPSARPDFGIEDAATNILTTMLHETGNFIVVPQQDMESILGQQKLGASGVINSSTATEMGKVLGLNAMNTSRSRRENERNINTSQRSKQPPCRVRCRAQRLRARASGCCTTSRT